MRIAVRFWFLGAVAVSAMVMSVNTALARSGSVFINEVMAKNASISVSGYVSDWIELFNTNSLPVNLAGYTLTDSNAYPTRYTFPAGVSIPGRGYLVLTCDSTRTNSSTNAMFGLGAAGGYVMLYAPGSTVVPVDVVQYGIQVEDYTIGCVPDGSTNWVLCNPTARGANQAATLGSVAGLRFNEWMADDGSGNDWFEIFNPTNKPVPLSGLRIFETNNTTWFTHYPLSFIGWGYTNGYVKYIADKTTANIPYDSDHVNFKLNATADRLLLYDSLNVLIDQVGWTVRQTEHVSEGRLPDGATNIVKFPRINDYATDSPGAANTLIMTNIAINELLSHTDPPVEDAVEFQNLGATAVDISGWWLSDSKRRPWSAKIPSGPAIPPGGFRVIYEYMFNNLATNYPVGFNTNGILRNFTFESAEGDGCHLFQVNSNGNLTGYRVSEVYEPSENGVSYGRYKTSVPGDYKFIALSRRTFGRDAPVSVPDFRTGTGLSNAYPKVGPVVVSEIMFAPPKRIYGTNLVAKEHPDEEYIELRNVTTNWVPLYYFDPSHPNFMTNSWRLQKAIKFSFPSNSWMMPTSHCLVVAFNPKTNWTALTNFCTRYTFPVTSSNLIFGPWEGQLNSAGDAIELYKPDQPQVWPHPNAGLVPFLRVDKVNYGTNDNTTGIYWAFSTNAINTGLSMTRKNGFLFGNDPINWTTNVTTAGKANPAPPTGDADVDGMPDSWEIAYGLHPSDSSDANTDLDGDGISNLQEYLRGTLPNNPDTDGDGMPDGWEVRYACNPLSPADANQDLDGDLMTNLKEYLTGTIPTNAASALRISAQHASSSANLTWPAVANFTYSVVYATGCAPSMSWTLYTNVAASPTDRTQQITVPTTGPRRYYRVGTP
ncbi:MAG: lamin tail domain-containing protein [Verrucomicrobia bacterium]|nr:lamin tail domain-containing protein [Verrucomicrobiota bacterium]